MSAVYTNPERSRSVYQFWKVSDQHIHIEDQCNDAASAMSVTNNAENVIQEISNILFLTDISAEPRTVTYRDTAGQVDLLLQDGEKFTGFEAGRGCFDKAVRR